MTPHFGDGIARHFDNAKGVAEISPGLPDSERATLGFAIHSTPHFRAKRGERSEYLLSERIKLTGPLRNPCNIFFRFV
jgi:hypothetical protein